MRLETLSLPSKSAGYCLPIAHEVSEISLVSAEAVRFHVTRRDGLIL